MNKLINCYCDLTKKNYDKLIIDGGYPNIKELDNLLNKNIFIYIKGKSMGYEFCIDIIEKENIDTDLQKIKIENNEWVKYFDENDFLDEDFDPFWMQKMRHPGKL